MGFWGSFLGTGIAHVYNEVKKEDIENKKWNDLHFELSNYETEFQNYLKSVGCKDIYVADYECVNIGNINPEKKKMDNIRNKIKEYVALGGNAFFISDLTQIDEDIDKIKYLIQKGCLDRQVEFANVCLCDIKSIIEKEEKTLFSQNNGNELLEQIKDDDVSLNDIIEIIKPLNEYCPFSALNNLLSLDTYNYSVRSRLIDLLLQAYLYDDRLSVELPLPYDIYKKGLAQLLRNQIEWFFKLEDNTSIKIQTLKDFYFIYLGEIELVQGNFYNAFRLFYLALHSKTLANDNESIFSNNNHSTLLFGDTISMIVMNMCQILATVNLRENAKVLQNKYAPLLNYNLYIAKDVYTKNQDNNYAKIVYDWYSDPTFPTAFQLSNYDEYLEENNVEQNLYDGSYFDKYVVDSTLVTFTELKEICIDNNKIIITRIATLNYQNVLNKNKEKIQKFLGESLDFKLVL